MKLTTDYPEGVHLYMQPTNQPQHQPYQIPQELINSILAEAGLESLTGDVEPLDDHISQR